VPCNCPASLLKTSRVISSHRPRAENKGSLERKQQRHSAGNARFHRRECWFMWWGDQRTRNCPHLPGWGWQLNSQRWWGKEWHADRVVWGSITLPSLSYSSRQRCQKERRFRRQLVLLSTHHPRLPVFQETFCSGGRSIRRVLESTSVRFPSKGSSSESRLL